MEKEKDALKIENDVLTIENGVLKRCKKDAVNVAIPDGVTEIGAGAFQDCSSLKSVVIPESVTKIGEGAFSGCTSLESVVIPKGVSEFGKGTFGCCESLESVVIGEGVTKIGELAFCYCSSLKSLSLPSTVTKIEKMAFEGCDAVEEIVSASASYPFSEKTHKLYRATKKSRKAILVLNAAKEKAKEVKVAEMQKEAATALLESILGEYKEEEDFVRTYRIIYNWKIIKYAIISINVANGGMDIVLPDSAAAKWKKTLPALLAFSRSCTDSAEVRKYAVDNGFKDASRKLLYSEKGVVSFCHKSAVNVVIPNRVRKIGVLGNCNSLKSIVIPSSVTEFEQFAFQGSKSLEYITFGGTASQWKAVKKGENWNKDVPAKTVKCTDGEVEI